MTSSAPCSWAISASCLMSATAVVGLAIVSAKMIRVAGPHRRPDRVEVGDVDEVRLDPEPRQHVPQQAVGAAVERGRRHHVRSRPGEGPEHPGDRRHPRGERLRGGPARQVGALHGRDRARERVHRRVVDPAVAVAGHLVAEHGRVLLGRGERERGGPVDRRAERPLRGSPAAAAGGLPWCSPQAACGLFPRTRLHQRDWSPVPTYRNGNVAVQAPYHSGLAERDASTAAASPTGKPPEITAATTSVIGISTPCLRASSSTGA